ncbi:expressed unknown protein [Seminavis robusta]|uniref:Uncharacterized protein n=1 Tax=Seminavis robusta TaxID=568900 RepID=A0A9N8HB89_9STRA|nr:expressed unknown protein [Seminavis robusta]|eukprot:Sro252_g099580.1 n/a (303) ;mRNA; f:24061-24969
MQDCSSATRNNRGVAIIVLAAGTFFVGGVFLVDTVPIGSVGVKKYNGGTRNSSSTATADPMHLQVLQPGWHLRDRLGANPPSQWSTRRQHATFRTRVMDGQGHKVFVTVLVQYQLTDPKAFIQQQQQFQNQNDEKDQDQHQQRNYMYPKSSVKANKNNQILQSLVVQQAKADLAKVFGRDQTIKLLYTRKETMLDLGKALTQLLNKNKDLSGIRTLQTTILDVELSYKVDREMKKLNQIVASRNYEIKKWKEHVQQIQDKSEEQLKRIAAETMNGSKTATPHRNHNNSNTRPDNGGSRDGRD